MEKVPSSRVWQTLWVSTAVAILFFTFALIGAPIERKFQISVDEGFNLQRSTLYNQGYQLYTEIASDQPPLFTILLAGVMRASGDSAVAARILVLFFSALTVFSIAASTGLSYGPGAAGWTLPLFFILPWYMHLSTAIMIGLPSIALAAMAVFFFILWKKNNNAWVLTASAILMAGSVFIKLFTGFIAPLIVLRIGMETIRSTGISLRPYAKWAPLLNWSIAFTVTVISFALGWYGFENILNALGTHFGGGTQNAFTSEEFTLWPHLTKSWLFLVLAIPGLYFIIKARLKNAYPLVAWAFLATLALAFYSPVWAHHQLLITVPLVGIQAIGVSSAIRVTVDAVRTRKFGFIAGLNLVICVFFIGMLIGHAPAQFKKLAFDGLPRLKVDVDQLILTQDERSILDLMRQYSPDTNWVVTDMPYFAHTIGKNVPPNLATFSTKMMRSGAITSNQVLVTIEETRPEQVLLGRISIKQVNNYLAENYVLVYEAEIGKLYIRPDIAAEK